MAFGEPVLEPMERKQSRCQREIENALLELDAEFGTQGVNNALDRIFTPSRGEAGNPPALAKLENVLSNLHEQFGESMVTTALYEVDKSRNPHIESDKVPVLTPEESAERDAVIASVLAAVRSLDKETIAMIVGNDEWEMNEFDAKIEVRLTHGEPRSLEALNQMLSLITQIKDLETSDVPDKSERIKKLGEEFNDL